MPDSANKITAEILIKAHAEIPNLRLWRMNTGVWVAWDRVKVAIALLGKRQYAAALSLLVNLRPIRSGINGQCDLTGVAAVYREGCSVCGNGATYGIRLEVEVKAEGDELNDDQIAYRDRMIPLGVIWILARSADQCVADLKKRLSELG